MSLCTTYPAANDLSYCAPIYGYGPGLLRIGELVNNVLTEPIAFLQNKATGRIQTLPLDPDNVPLLLAEFPDDLSPHTLYELWVNAQSPTSGIVPVTFYPYQYTPATGLFTVAADAVEGVTVKFIKLHDGANIHGYETQWITLK